MGDTPLVIGMELAYRPFEMTDENGEPAGVSVDMARDLGAYLEREVEIRNLPFDALIPSLRTGRIDLILSSMTATDDRRKSIDFSDPYLFTGLAILTGRTGNVNSIADLNAAGKIVAVKQGTTGHIYARNALPLATVRLFDEENACVLEVIQGKADAFLYDQMSVYKHAERQPDTLRALLDPFTREAWAIGVRKGNDELRLSVNEFLQAYRAEGGFEQLAVTYFPEMRAAFAELGIPFVFDLRGN